MKHVPEEIIMEILSRLAVKFLCRFKCVSKAWCNLMSTPHFVKLQLNQSVKSNRLTYVMYDCFEFPRRLELDYDSLLSGHQVKLLAKESSFGLTNGGCAFLEFYFGKTRVLGSCNGLFCCTSAPPKSIALVNPSTRETKTILSQHGHQIEPLSVAGFGYDALHDDYKVVRIDCGIRTVGVYSLKNGAWSCIGDFPHHIIGDSVHLNGVIHWITCYGSETALSITALDLTKQEFSRFPTVSRADLVPVQLYAMGGNLCVGCYRRGQELCEFWVMEIYGKVESWKRIGLSLKCRSMPSVLDLPRSEEALIVTEGRLFIYNHRKESLKEVNIAQIPKGYDRLWLNSVFPYQDNLVAL
ncbi:hypothetical protein V6N11_060980 [Hibiscus sabdariffa]|uniref:F-box domain-containing protein n=2 Tax=Hibiscus sabdariffa TaxID=183260 RepID=A0ABR2QRX1_9ROSI